MADERDITPEELAEAYRLFLVTGSYSATARQMGRSEAGIRKALKRHLGTIRDEAHTYALARAERDCRRALVQVRGKLKELLETSTDYKEVTAVAAQIHDNARATTSMRVAHAKLTGGHAPEKIETTHDVRDAIAASLARLAGSADPGEAGGVRREPDEE